MSEPFSLQRQLTEIQEGVQKGVNVLVVGPAGSGRRTLFTHLKQQFPNALAIDLLSLDEVDAPSVAILEALSALRLPVRPLDDADALYDAARTVATTLEASSDRPLVLRVPRDWATIARQDEADDPRLSQANSVIRGLTSTRATVVIVADERFDRSHVMLGAVRHIELPARETSLALLEPHESWGPLQPSVVALREHAPSASPVLLRLLVGAVASGLAPQTAVGWAKQGNIEALVHTIIARVLTVEGGAECLGALSALRAVVSIDSIQRILPVDPVANALVTRCLGYGVESFRVSDEARAVLRERCHPGERHHEALAAVHRALDGVTDPTTIRGQLTMRHWAEKVHHLGAAGSHADREWSEQRLPSPAFHWDRARALSAKKQFARAVEAYRACVSQFPNDDYGWHYLGFNLAACGGDAEQIVEAYRKAVELAPNKAWWVGRLVSFLIRRNRLDEARGVWANSQRNLIHDGRLCRDPILAMQLHRWVARDWLSNGCVDEARNVLASVDRAVVEGEPDLQALSQDIHAALFRRYGPSTLAARDALLAELAGLRREHPSLPFPAIEAVGEALRMSWDDGAVLVQIDLEDGFELEWYARDHQTKDSAAGVGQENRATLAQWLKRASQP